MTATTLRRNRDYQRLWSAAIVSELGSSMAILAFPLLVLSLGGGAAQAGAVGTCSLLTRLVLRMPGGHLADRMNRRWLMIGTDVVRLAAVATIPLAYAMDSLTFPHLLVVATIEGAATALFGAAAPVALRDIVPREHLVDAFSMNQARIAGVALAGPALGGVLFGIHPMVPFTVDAASYAVSAVLLFAIRTKPRDRSGATTDRRITAGLRWLTGQPEVIRILLFCSVLNLIGAAAEVGLVISLRTDGTPTQTIGLIMTCAGVGALVGSILAPRIIKLLSTRTLLVVVTLVWVAGLSSFATTSSPWVVAPALVAMILLTPACGIKLSEITVGRAPSDVLGRVSTAEMTISAGLAAPGPLLVGISIALLGSSGTWLVLAGICVVTLVGVVVARAGSGTERLVAQEPLSEPTPTPAPAPTPAPEPVTTQGQA